MDRVNGNSMPCQWWMKQNRDTYKHRLPTNIQG
jgi:hypothetical protein